MLQESTPPSPVLSALKNKSPFCTYSLLHVPGDSSGFLCGSYVLQSVSTQTSQMIVARGEVLESHLPPSGVSAPK
jgi:hypothetical protein